MLILSYPEIIPESHIKTVKTLPFLKEFTEFSWVDKSPSGFQALVSTCVSEHYSIFVLKTSMSCFKRLLGVCTELQTTVLLKIFKNICSESLKQHNRKTRRQSQHFRPDLVKDETKYLLKDRHLCIPWGPWVSDLLLEALQISSS